MPILAFYCPVHGAEVLVTEELKKYVTLSNRFLGRYWCPKPDCREVLREMSKKPGK